MLKLIRYSINTLALSILFCITNLVYAESPQGPSIGAVANNLTEPLGAFTTLFYNICYIIGATLIMGSGVQYKHYRDNPVQTPISRPILLFIVGVVFILLPFIGRLSVSASMINS